VSTAPYERSLGVRVEAVEAERARIRIPYKDENSNPGRALHGGVPASAIDVAGVLAASAGRDGAGLETGTLDLSVLYLAAAIGEDIVAEAQVLRRGKELTYVDVDVRTDAGKRIAKGLVTHRAAPPGPADRQLALPHAEPAGAAAGEVPSLARAIVATPFIARLALRIERMHQGSARIVMPFAGENTDASGAVHEGALAALLDTTGAMASWSVVGLDLRHRASTVGIHVAYHRAVRDEDVVGHATTLSRNDEIFLNTVTLVGARSARVVATGSVTYRIVVAA
jgi:uncharacterized protein (TIGR00369 family)